MKRIIRLTAIIIAIFNSASAQKLTEPKLLGNWISGEDPSEFLLHNVMEYSQGLLEENPEGKLIVRVCSPDELSTAFIKAPLNPLSASQYNKYRLLVPNERIFIANSSKCFEGKKVVFNQYWFVPNENTLEYEEIIPVNNIGYESFVIDDSDFGDNKPDAKSIEAKNEEFTENIIEFAVKLKNNPKAKGFIVHNSKNRAMKRNVEKVKAFLRRENIDLQKVKTIIRIGLYADKNGKLKPIKDEKKSFPSLAVITVKE